MSGEAAKVTAAHLAGSAEVRVRGIGPMGLEDRSIRIGWMETR
jgi:hypothetical protein